MNVLQYKLNINQTKNPVRVFARKSDMTHKAVGADVILAQNPVSQVS